MERAYFQVPELRGFEKFAEGRPAEDMPQITSRICGVCPTAHHMAATKALDALYKVEPAAGGARRSASWSTAPSWSRTTRCTSTSWAARTSWSARRAPTAERNILGVIGKVGLEIGKKVIAMRKQAARADRAGRRQGRSIRCSACPAAWPSAITEEEQAAVQRGGGRGGRVRPVHAWSLRRHRAEEPGYVDLILSDAYTHRTYYMGLVDENNKVNFYDGQLRVVTPEGKEFAKFDPAQTTWSTSPSTSSRGATSSSAT